MNSDGEAILHNLDKVWVERDRRGTNAGLLSRVTGVKAFQQSRFRKTYADLLEGSAYASAASFFLEELYGPGDFSARDRQFQRVVPSLVRLFPREVVSTVKLLAELHAVSEQLDTRMGEALATGALSPEIYVQAWLDVGEPSLRARQVDLTVKVGRALTGLTRNPLLRTVLRGMRRPALMAGLAELQRFLETGFDTFRSMPSAYWFLETIRKRETDVIASLFDGDTSLI